MQENLWDETVENPTIIFKFGSRELAEKFTEHVNEMFIIKPKIRQKTQGEAPALIPRQS